MTVVPPTLFGEISTEADRIRADGTLPAGYEAELRGAFEDIAADPHALEAEVARQASLAARSGARSATMAHRAAGKAMRVTRRAAGAARRRAGPHLRTVERRGVERASRSLEVAAAGLQVVADRGRRLAAGTLAERGIARASGEAGLGLPAFAAPAALRVDAAGRLGDADLDRFVAARFTGRRGPVLHAECGDGRLVARLREAGVDIRGVDPRLADREQRRGALEALAGAEKASLSGILLSGTTDRVTPGSARALARLAATRLAPGGALVLLSAAPGPRDESDPVLSDLSRGRPLHPVTWCHLLARLGLEEISVRETAGGDAYAVAAVRPRS